jgi:hypothetical protein
MKKQNNTLPLVLGIVSIVCSLITLIYFAAGVGVVATYSNKNIGTWGMSVLTFGGSEGLTKLGASGGLITGFILAILSLIVEAVALFSLFYPKAKTYLPIFSAIAALLLFVSAILLFNAKNLAIDTSGKQVFVNSVYSQTFSTISLGKGAIIGGIFGIFGFLFDAVNSIVGYLKR